MKKWDIDYRSRQLKQENRVAPWGTPGEFYSRKDGEKAMRAAKVSVAFVTGPVQHYLLFRHLSLQIPL
jgi:hypothetical protein